MMPGKHFLTYFVQDHAHVVPLGFATTTHVRQLTIQIQICEWGQKVVEKIFFFFLLNFKLCCCGCTPHCAYSNLWPSGLSVLKMKVIMWTNDATVHTLNNTELF